MLRNGLKNEKKIYECFTNKLLQMNYLLTDSLTNIKNSYNIVQLYRYFSLLIYQM